MNTYEYLPKNKRKTNKPDKPDKPKFTPHSPTPEIVQRFDINDEEGYKFLEENGFVVFKDVATPEELEKGQGLCWDFLEGLGVGISRNDIQSWNVEGWPNPFANGIVPGAGVGQSAFLWFVRGLPSVKTIFSKIWNTDELITSFDGLCIHRPFEYDATWKTRSSMWYHLDQNGHNKPGRICVQGFLNFYPAGIHDGGLVVVPKSHTIFNQIFKNRKWLAKRQDFISLSNDRQLWEYEVPNAGLKPIIVCAEAGDFVLWDSRTIHCNSPADTLREIPTDGTILPPRRLVAYVCMTPRARLTPECQEARVKCYKTGQTTSHWPEDVTVAAVRKNHKRYKPIELSEEQKKLIPLE